MRFPGIMQDPAASRLASQFHDPRAGRELVRGRLLLASHLHQRPEACELEPRRSHRPAELDPRLPELARGVRVARIEGRPVQRPQGVLHASRVAQRLV